MTRIPPILVVALFGMLAVLSVKRVRFSSDLYELLPRDLPEVRGMEELNRFFSRSGQLVVTLKGEAPWAVEEASASLADHLRGHPELVAEVFRELSPEDLVKRGGGLLAWTWLNAPPEVLGGLEARLAPGTSRETIARSLATAKDEFAAPERAFVASYDPLGLARLDDALENGGAARSDPMRSDDGTFEVLYVEGRGVDFGDYRAAQGWLRRLRTVVADWESGWRAAHAGEEAVRTGLTGTPAFMAEVGGEMEKDLSVSVALTVILISILFYVMHRQLRPLSWLLAAMLGILAATLFIAGLVYGDLSVMSVGFAAILMGLAVDYGIVLFREARETGHDARALRRSVGPGIFWAALTTGTVFLSLNFSSLPGLAEMGNLVAIGVLVGALVMLFLFAPVAAGFARDHPAGGGGPSGGTGSLRPVASPLAVVLPLLAAGSILLGDRPHLEPNFHPFRIRESPAMQAWQQLQAELRGGARAIPLIVTARTHADLHRHLEAARQRIGAAETSGLLVSSRLAVHWIPHPAHQQRNAAAIGRILDHRERLLGEVDAAGFSAEGSLLADEVFEAWRRQLARLRDHELVLPGDGFARWSLDRVFREKDGLVAALAAVTPAMPRDRRWVEAICSADTSVASLGSLGTALNERIRGDLTRVFLPMVGLLTLMLAIVYRSWKDLLLSLLCLAVSASILVIVTAWTPLEWNSFNVFGLPILFGTGLDFSIHMIFALRRGGDDRGAAQGVMAKALIFCGLSSAIGFGSLATASAHGLSSLGIVCAIGILVNMFVAVGLLPHWFRRLHGLRD
ncbi:MAG: MMPL family transporter [Akkermansiaceae bacterium]|nr:MMPL family transporter [Akkermansiaceae bacterium]